MKRIITDELIKWKESNHRKPLLLTGVRQCGKTYSIKKFGAEHFENTCYVNFEENNNLIQIFDYNFDTERIIRELELNIGEKVIIGKTLLFFDEIQECPRAITSLKYFCENMPGLHIVAAGSLLGVAIRKENISFPVGKVDRLNMYPMSFVEFVWALDEEKYINLLSTWDNNREIPKAYTIPMEELLMNYYAIGGMPAVVLEYIETKNYEQVQKIQRDILLDYEEDFSKHVPIKEIEKMRLIWESIPLQLAKDNNKFVFSHVKKGKRAHELESSLQWLKNAGLIHTLSLVQNAEIPLELYADATFFKVYMSDIGLLSRRLGLTINNFVNKDDPLKTAKGAITENYVMNELICQGKKPFYWKSGNTAELDFIIEKQGKVVPIEVKAATNTQAKSYIQFCKKYEPSIGYKASLKNIATNYVEKTKTYSIPLYLLWNMENYH